MGDNDISLKILADPAITSMNEHGTLVINQRIRRLLKPEDTGNYCALPVKMVNCSGQYKGYEGEVAILLYPIEISPRKKT